MKKNPEEKDLTARAIIAGFLAGTVAVLALAVALYHWGPGNMWLGAISGGAATLLLLGFGTWRSLRRPESATLADRTFALGSVKDERDTKILSTAAATVGYLALPLTAAATVAIAVGAPTLPTMTVLLYLQLTIAIATFVYQARRN